MSKYLDSTTKLLDPRSRDLEPAEGDVACIGGQVKGVDVENRTITAVVSNNSVDRFQEIVEASAFAKWLPTFMQNPVFLAGHRHVGFDAAEPTTIGSWQDMRVADNQLIGTAKFADTPLADRYWNLYRDGHMRAFSVGFIVHQWEMREFELAPGVSKKIRVFTEVELIEVSAVAVPANREALARAAAALEAGWSGDGAGGTDAATLAKFIKDLDTSIDERLEAALVKHLSTDPGSPLCTLIQDVVETCASAGHLRGHDDDATAKGRADESAKIDETIKLLQSLKR